jgi:hypothetical protein
MSRTGRFLSSRSRTLWLIAYSAAAVGFWATIVMSMQYPVPSGLAFVIGIGLLLAGGIFSSHAGHAFACLVIFIVIGLASIPIGADHTNALYGIAWVFVCAMAIVATIVGWLIALAIGRSGSRAVAPPVWVAMAAVILSAVPIVIAVKDRNRTVRANHDPAVAVDEIHGSFGGVSFGDPAEVAIAKLGPPERRHSGKNGYLLYPDVTLKLSRGLLVELEFRTERATTSAGLGIGDSISLLEAANPGLTCEDDRRGVDSGEPFRSCTGLIGPRVDALIEGEYTEPGVPVDAIRLRAISP